MRAAVQTAHHMRSEAQENSLKCILSALWNLSAHSNENKAEICETEEGLALLVTCMSGHASWQSGLVVETAGGILCNVACLVAMREDHRAILRQHDCLEILVKHLKACSLPWVTNACGILRNLSARNAADQQRLRDLGAIPLVKELCRNKDNQIATASAGTFRNLTGSAPDAVLYPTLSSRNHRSPNDRNHVTAADRNIVSPIERSRVSAADRNHMSSADRNHVASSDRNHVASADRNHVASADRSHLMTNGRSHGPSTDRMVMSAGDLYADDSHLELHSNGSGGSQHSGNSNECIWQKGMHPSETTTRTVSVVAGGSVSGAAVDHSLYEAEDEEDDQIGVEDTLKFYNSESTPFLSVAPSLNDIRGSVRDEPTVSAPQQPQSSRGGTALSTGEC